jgi:hypothetical protein
MAEPEDNQSDSLQEIMIMKPQRANQQKSEKRRSQKDGPRQGGYHYATDQTYERLDTQNSNSVKPQSKTTIIEKRS